MILWYLFFISHKEILNFLSTDIFALENWYIFQEPLTYFPLIIEKLIQISVCSCDFKSLEWHQVDILIPFGSFSIKKFCWMKLYKRICCVYWLLSNAHRHLGNESKLKKYKIWIIKKSILSIICRFLLLKISNYLYMSTPTRSHNLISECTKNYSEAILRQKSFYEY